MRRRRRWVFDSLDTLRERTGAWAGLADRARPRRRFVSGAKVLYRGRRMRLRIVPAQAHGSHPGRSDGDGVRERNGGALQSSDGAAFHGRNGPGLRRRPGDGVRVEHRGGFVVHAPDDPDPDRRDACIGAALEAWFRERVREDAERLVRRHAPRLAVELAGVRLAEHKHLWGSCGRDGVIRLNWQLVFAPRAVLEYAVVHELCHLRERSHGSAFWRVLREALPEYETAKAWLERYAWVCRWR